MRSDLKEHVRSLIEPLLANEGGELVDLTLSAYRNRHTLRLFVYAGQGTTIDDCARLSRVVGEYIDGTDLFAGGYTLEVSSPGLDRPLTTLSDFAHRIGETVVVTFRAPGRPKWEARIVAVKESDVVFEQATGEQSIPLAEIESARIVV